jgi:hypothetical protein
MCLVQSGHHLDASPIRAFQGIPKDSTNQEAIGNGTAVEGEARVTSKGEVARTKREQPTSAAERQGIGKR